MSLIEWPFFIIFAICYLLIMAAPFIGILLALVAGFTVVVALVKAVFGRR